TWPHSEWISEFETANSTNHRNRRKALNTASAWPCPVQFWNGVQELFSFGNGFSLIVTFDYSIDINPDMNGGWGSKEISSILAVRLQNRPDTIAFILNFQHGTFPTAWMSGHPLRIGGAESSTLRRILGRGGGKSVRPYQTECILRRAVSFLFAPCLPTTILTA